MMLGVHHMTHWIAWTVGGNLRRQKNRWLALPFHRNEMNSRLLVGVFVCGASLVVRLHVDWRATIAPRWVLIYLGSRGLWFGCWLCVLLSEGLSIRQSVWACGSSCKRSSVGDCDWLKENAVYRVDKHQDDTDTKCECNSTIRYGNVEMKMWLLAHLMSILRGLLAGPWSTATGRWVQNIWNSWFCAALCVYGKLFGDRSFGNVALGISVALGIVGSEPSMARTRVRSWCW